MEIRGKIMEIIESENGFILGEDGLEYTFTILDFLKIEPIEVGTTVMFKPNHVSLKKQDMYYATLITKED